MFPSFAEIAQQGEHDALTEAEMEAVLVAVDTNGDNRISLGEFQAFINNADDLIKAIGDVTSSLSQTPYGMPDLRTAFRKFDKDGSMALEPDEFKAAIKSLGCDLTSLEVRRQP